MAIADIQYELKNSEEWVGRRLTKAEPKGNPVWALWRMAKGRAVEGRALRAYFNSTTRGRGRAHNVAENGALPTGGQTATQQNYVDALFGALAFEVNDAEVAAWKGRKKAANRETLAKKMVEAVTTHRERMLADFFTRDDSVKARILDGYGTDASSLAWFYSTIPVRLVVGDLLTSYEQTTNAGDERLLTTAAAIEAVSAVATTPVYVDDIDVDIDQAGACAKVTMSRAVDGSGDVGQPVVLVYGAALATSGYGLESLFDTVLPATTTFGWDAYDYGTVDHGQETGAANYYAGLIRANYANLNSGLMDAGGGQLTLGLLSRAVQKSLYKAGQGKRNKMVALMNGLEYDRFLQTQEGKSAPGRKIKLAGVDYELPAHAIGAGLPLPVLTTPYIADGVVAVFPKDILRKVFKEVGWDEKGLSRPTNSGGVRLAKFLTHWTYWQNTYCDLPNQCTLVHNLSTNND